MTDDDDKKEYREENERRTCTTRSQQQAASGEQPQQQLKRMNRELERVQTELRITIILKNDLEVKLDRTQKELIQAQTKVYTTSKKHERIMNYVNWLDYEYKTEVGSSRTVSTKFIRENLS